MSKNKKNKPVKPNKLDETDLDLTFGIYLGNSSCCLSTNKKSIIAVVANAGGERVTPVIIGYQDKEIVTGTAAKQGLVRHEKSSISGVLRAIGSNEEDVFQFPSSLKCQLNHQKGIKYKVNMDTDTKMVFAEDILTRIFTLLKEIASSHHSQSEGFRLVLTLPAWVNEEAEAAAMRTATAQGFTVLKTISQPVAACLAYSLLDDNEITMNVVTLHCGGTSASASLCRVNYGLLSVVDTVHMDAHVSTGDAMTERLVQHFAKEFFRKYKGDVLENRRSKRKLFMASEDCKHVLSNLHTSEIHVDSLWEGVDFSSPLSRARFDDLISNEVSDLVALAKRLLDDNGIIGADVDKLVLSGGTCKIPKVCDAVSGLFPNAELLRSYPFDEVLAVGASKEAPLAAADLPPPILPTKSNKYKMTAPVPTPPDPQDFSCLSANIFVTISECDDSKPYLVMGEGLPAPWQTSLQLPCPAQPCQMLLYEANEEVDNPNEEQILAQVDLNFEEECSLQFEFQLKRDGSIVVNYSEPESNMNASFIIEAAADT